MIDNPITPRSTPKILIVDDRPGNVQLLAGMLKKHGYKIHIALSGKMALLAAHNDPPDLILLDITMPEMDGFEVCRNLKEDKQLRDIPVIFISALSNIPDKVKAFAVGGVDYMTKPFQLEEVETRVATHLMLKDAREYLKEKNQFLESAFSRYVSPKVVEQLKKRPVNELLHMERRTVTVLFADLRDSTSLAFDISPEDLQETINSALEVMVDCIDAYDGLVDKFLGDGLMAIFGAPIPQENHAWRAIQTSMMMQKRYGDWMAQRKGKRPVRPLGIGIATGEVVVGNYGTLRRMEYTALGQAVNLAANLSHVAEGDEILTTPVTRDEALRFAGEKSQGLTASFLIKGDIPSNTKTIRCK